MKKLKPSKEQKLILKAIQDSNKPPIPMFMRRPHYHDKNYAHFMDALKYFQNCGVPKEERTIQVYYDEINIMGTEKCSKLMKQLKISQKD